jgi:hypothetical protein
MRFKDFVVLLNQQISSIMNFNINNYVELMALLPLGRPK